MASRKTPESKPEPNLAEAAEKASMVIRGLQARLHQRALDPAEESAEDLERQLAQYFRKAVPIPETALDHLRRRVVDAVADRILQAWDCNSAIEDSVLQALIERLLDRFSRQTL